MMIEASKESDNRIHPSQDLENEMKTWVKKLQIQKVLSFLTPSARHDDPLIVEDTRLTTNKTNGMKKKLTYRRCRPKSRKQFPHFFASRSLHWVSEKNLLRLGVDLGSN